MEYCKDDFLPVYPEYRGGFQTVARFSGRGETFACLVGVFDGSTFGSEWLARKLEFKHPVKSLREEKNWYLPFRTEE